MIGICRLCAKYHILYTTNITDPDHSIPSKILQYCQLELSKDIRLPQNVCVECVDSLNSTIEFIENVKNAQVTLVSSFIGSDVEEEHLNGSEQELKIKPEEFDDFSFNGDDDDFTDNAELLTENEYINQSPLNLFQPSDQLPSGEIKEERVNELKLNRWNNYKWECKECYSIETSYPQLIKHYKDFHSDTTIKYTCFNCTDKIYLNYQEFLQHVITEHHPLLELCCDICSNFYYSRSLLEEHKHAIHETQFVDESLPIVTRQKSYKCDDCDKTFNTRSNLKVHKRIHMGIRDYTCEQCGKSFLQKGVLKNHMLIHVPARPYACAECDKT